ncbi:MAG: DUF2298 domain-containing protein [Halobacteriovoraceae bacterium]|nr:DUF2298 domain-containing protein [Halobacteriovoraceae bacterium]
MAILFLFYLNWIFSSIGIMKFSSPSLSFTLLLVVLGLNLLINKKRELIDILQEYSGHILRAELLFLVFFIFFLSIHSLHPEIYWGEKPMDFTLFNYSIRQVEFPLLDPWFAGEVMKYYYWGYTIFAGLSKMAGIQGEIGYALSLATIPALMASSLYSLMIFLVKKKNLAFGAALLIPLAGNFKAFTAIVFSKVKADMLYFFSSTRVFERGEFAEYPSWSILFADLHPHVMAYPFIILTLLFLFYGLRYVWEKFDYKEHGLFFFFYSLCFGSLIGINGWDFVVYSIFNSLYFLFHFKTIKKIKVWGLFFLVHATGPLLFLPMLLSLNGGVEKKWGPWMDSTNSFMAHFNHHGLWWVISLLMFTPLLFLKWKSIRWKVIFDSMGFRLTICTLLMAIFAENFVFMDRINTIFKVFNNVYIWAALIACIGLRYFKFYLRKPPLIPFAFFSFATVAILILGTFFNISALTNNRIFGKRGYGLKGSKFLKAISPGDFAVISWIKQNVKGTPSMVERYSRSFDHRAARISMHTGVPTYLGWDNHVHLRGQKWAKINKRKRDIDYIFNSTDPLKVHEFMLQKQLNFLVVGNLERKYYSSKGLEKFNQYRDIFTPLVNSRGTTLYGVGNFQTYLGNRIGKKQ